MWNDTQVRSVHILNIHCAIHGTRVINSEMLIMLRVIVNKRPLCKFLMSDMMKNKGPVINYGEGVVVKFYPNKKRRRKKFWPF